MAFKFVFFVVFANLAQSAVVQSAKGDSANTWGTALNKWQEETEKFFKGYNIALQGGNEADIVSNFKKAETLLRSGYKVYVNKLVELHPDMSKGAKTLEKNYKHTAQIIVGEFQSAALAFQSSNSLEEISTIRNRLTSTAITRVSAGINQIRNGQWFDLVSEKALGNAKNQLIEGLIDWMNKCVDASQIPVVAKGQPTKEHAKQLDTFKIEALTAMEEYVALWASTFDIVKNAKPEQ